ncbi:MAG: class I SAM-dependent methyltransferase [Bacteroidota bacterium]
MPHPFSVALLRAALRLASISDLPDPARASVQYGSRLVLTDGEQADERAIDDLRARLGTSLAEVEVVDFGAGSRGGKKAPVRRVADVYRRAATGPTWGRFLYGLVRGPRPKSVLELGTNLGVGAAHLASALARNERQHGVPGRLVTLEGAPAYAEIARDAMEGLGLADRVEVVVGSFAETLAGVCEREGPFDLVFIDGHHEAEATARYVEQIRPHLAPGALVILDDVEPSRPVRKTWRRLAEDAAGSAWLWKYGLLVFDDHSPRTAIRGARRA